MYVKKKKMKEKEEYDINKKLKEEIIVIEIMEKEIKKEIKI
jgi:hypothetical protein